MLTSGYMRAFDAETGEEIWEVQLKERVHQDDGTLGSILDYLWDIF